MRKNYRLLLFPAVVIFTASAVLFFQPRHPIFPDEKTRVITYCDEKLGGSTVIHDVENEKEHLTFSYILGEGYSSPYAGCGFSTGDRSKYWDMSNYDYIVVKIRTTKSRTLRLFIYTYVEGHTNVNNIMTFAFNLTEIPTWKQQNTYKISLEEFSIPQWWYSLNDMLPDDNEKSIQDFSKTHSVDIQNGLIVPMNVRDTVVVEEITFIKSRKPIYVISSTLIGLYILIISIYFFFFRTSYKQSQSKENLVVPYNQLIKEPHINNDLKIITKYIGESYMHSSLTIANVAENCGISQKIISGLIKEKYNVSFPRYINLIRGAEAKRLLRSSSLKIVEIAKTTGFGNVSHFNRVFKDQEGVTPQQYRDS